MHINQIEEDSGSFLHAELLAKGPVVDIHLCGCLWVLDNRQLVDMLKCFLGAFPVFLFDFNFGSHQHKGWVILDGEVLRKGLLKVVVGCLHITCIRVDKRCQDMGLNHGLVFVKAVTDFPQCTWGVIE